MLTSAGGGSTAGDGPDWKVDFCIQDWEAWAPGLEDKAAWRAWAAKSGADAVFAPGAAPALKAMPSLLRRRASQPDRLALEVAYRLAPKGEDIVSVFASRHGEVGRSVEMLQAMAKGEAPLPMGFSLSVHNAASGLFSIAREDRSASNSVAAHKDTLANAVLEACGQLAEGRPRVLVVFFDDELPVPYRDFIDEHPTGFSLGLLLSREGGDGYTLSSKAAPPGREEAGGPQALDVLRFLASGAHALDLEQGPRRWSWRRR